MLDDIPVPEQGEAFIVVTEQHLVKLVEVILTAGLQAGRDTGIISYNETAVKKIILNGITTVSADFATMSREAATIVRTGVCRRIAVPFHLTLRDSL